MKKLGILALTVSLVGSMASAALAVPDPGDGWSLVETQKVRYFLPGDTPPADGTLADAATAKALDKGDSFAANEWSLIATENVRYFVPDSGTTGAQLINSAYVSTRTASETYYVGRSGKVAGTSYLGDPVDEADSTKWQVENLANGTVRYFIPRYQTTYTPYTIYEQYGTRTREVTTYNKTYRKDLDVVSTGGEHLVDTRTFSQNEDAFSAWTLSGAQSRLNQVYSTGTDQSVASVDPLVYTYSPNSVSPMAAAQAAGSSHDSLAGRSSGAGNVTVSNSFVNTGRARMTVASSANTSGATSLTTSDVNNVQDALVASSKANKAADALEELVNEVLPSETTTSTSPGNQNAQVASNPALDQAKQEVLDAYLACEQVLNEYKETFDSKYGSGSLNNSSKKAFKDAKKAYKKAAKAYKRLFNQDPPRYNKKHEED